MADPDNVALNVAAVARASRVNGPGVRAVVWVQGCTIGCPGCFNPHTHPHKARRLVDPVALAGELCDLPGLDGITLSGGEPFEQAAACHRFAQEVRARGRTLMVFTGYPFDLLAASPAPEVKLLLGEIDIVVAGPYIRAKSIQPINWRSSANQRLHALTSAGKLALREHLPDAACVEAFSDGRALVWSGFPEGEDVVWLDAAACLVTPPPY